MHTRDSNKPVQRGLVARQTNFGHQGGDVRGIKKRRYKSPSSSQSEGLQSLDEMLDSDASVVEYGRNQNRRERKTSRKNTVLDF